MMDQMIESFVDISYMFALLLAISAPLFIFYLLVKIIIFFVRKYYLDLPIKQKENENDSWKRTYKNDDEASFTNTRGASKKDKL